MDTPTVRQGEGYAANVAAALQWGWVPGDGDRVVGSILRGAAVYWRYLCADGEERVSYVEHLGRAGK